MSGFDYLDAAFDADLGAACCGGSDLGDALARLRLSAAGLAKLLQLGVERHLLAQLCAAGDVATAQVSLGRGGLFEWDGPDRRLILAVREEGELVDLLALASHDENEWALRRGVAEFLGAEWLLRTVLEERRELRLFGTPMGWLRGGGAGVCVLDWTASALAALRGLGPRVTIVADNGARAKLQGLLAHGGLPLVAEEHQMRRAA